MPSLPATVCAGWIRSDGHDGWCCSLAVCCPFALAGGQGWDALASHLLPCRLLADGRGRLRFTALGQNSCHPWRRSSSLEQTRAGTWQQCAVSTQAAPDGCCACNVCRLNQAERAHACLTANLLTVRRRAETETRCNGLVRALSRVRGDDWRDSEVGVYYAMDVFQSQHLAAGGPSASRLPPIHKGATLDLSRPPP